MSLWLSHKHHYFDFLVGNKIRLLTATPVLLRYSNNCPASLQFIHVLGNMRCVASSETCIEILKLVRCLSKNHRGVASGIQINLHPWWHLPTFRIQVRGKKSKATIQLKDLPQGVLKPDSSVSDWKDERPAYPTVVQQARNNMRTFSDCVLLTRVGGFYEVCLMIRGQLIHGGADDVPSSTLSTRKNMDPF